MPGMPCAPPTRQDSKDGCDEPGSAFVCAVAEKVCALDRRKRAASADVAIWNFAVIQTDRDQPRIVRRSHAQLLDRQGKLLVLIGLSAGEALPGEAGDEHKRVVCDRLPNLSPPVLTRPQISRIPPHPDARLFQPALQSVDVVGVLTHIGYERMTQELLQLRRQRSAPCSCTRRRRSRSIAALSVSAGSSASGHSGSLSISHTSSCSPARPRYSASWPKNRRCGRTPRSHAPIVCCRTPNRSPSSAWVRSSVSR